MELTKTNLDGVFEVKPKVSHDSRGVFVKTYHKDMFKQCGLQTTWDEEYYSISNKNVIRGLHFQEPPFDHEKLVYCLSGSVLDILVDLRHDSPTYKKHIKVVLSGTNYKLLYIPKGIAHGFKSLENNSTMVYRTSTIYNTKLDNGILWSSCNVDWELEEPPIISERDKLFLSLENFISPFK